MAFFVVEAFLGFGIYTRVVNLFIYAMRYYNLSKKFHKDSVATTIFGAIFSAIVEMVYGLGSSYTYDASVQVGNCGFLNNPNK